MQGDWVVDAGLDAMGGQMVLEFIAAGSPDCEQMPGVAAAVGSRLQAKG